MRDRSQDRIGTKGLLSGATSTNFAMSQKGSYVWDEWSDEEPTTTQVSKSITDNDYFDDYNDSKSTVSSLEGESRAGRSAYDSIASEITVKVDRMKKELNTKVQTAKQLQAELLRVKAAKERKIEKCRVTWDGKLASIREQNAAASHKLDELYQRLQADVQKLTEQVQGLETRLTQSKAHQAEALVQAKRDAEKRLMRAKRQWEADESLSFEKVIKKKAEVLQKQAADSFGPKLDKMVKEGKQKVSEIKDDGEVRLQKLQFSLQAEHETKIAECRDKLTEQIQHDLDKVKRQLQRQLEDVQKQQQTELTALQDKYARETTTLDEAFERAQRLEHEQTQDALQSISKRETLQTQEILDKQQREVGYLVESHASALNKFKAALREQQEQGEHKSAQLRAALREQQLQRRKDGITRKISTETERVLQKLRQDAAQERQRIQRGYEDKVAAVREKVQLQLESKQEVEQREMSRLAALNAEIDSFKAQCQRLQDAENASKTALSQRLKPALADLREELRSVEREFQQLAPKHEDELHHRRQELESEVSALRDKVRVQQDALEAQRQQQEEQRDSVEQSYVAELTRIKDKISALLRKKESTRDELSAQLGQLQSTSSELQEALEQLRNSTMGV